MPILGNYLVVWEYDSIKHRTYCTIHNLDKRIIVDVNVKLIRNNEYDKVRARTLSFKKALKEVDRRKLLSEEEIQRLKQGFADLPNKGVI